MAAQPGYDAGGGTAAPPGNYPQGGPPIGKAGWDPTIMDIGPAPTVLGGHGTKHGPMAGMPGDGAELQAIAPPIDRMATIQGYQGVGFEGTTAPAPIYDSVMQGEAPKRDAPTNVHVLSEKEARQALLDHVSSHSCYGKKPAEQLRFIELKTTSAFKYTLESFTESRSTAWAHEPYNGQSVDGPMNGPAPGPWEIQVQPKKDFRNHQEQVEIPHTASVTPCHQCVSNGRVRCNQCHGDGQVHCDRCQGQGRERQYVDGRHEYRDCTWCLGRGRQRCQSCDGEGHRQCPACQGRCRLKCYLKLTVKWTHHQDDHIVEKTDLPDRLIKKVPGQTAFDEELPWVWPINHFPDPMINAASDQLVQKHRTEFANLRICKQRHKVNIVPVTEVRAEYDGKEFTYFVFGFVRKIYAPDYPARRCCGCSIL